MDPAKAMLAKNTAILDGYGKKIPPVQAAAAAVGVNPGAIIAAALFVLCLIFLMFEGFAIVVTICMVVYPGLLSIRAIETKETDDDKAWLTYWMIYGTLHVLETFLPFIFYFIPYWDWIRLGLFVYMIKFNGAAQIHASVVENLIKEHGDEVSAFFNKFAPMASKITESLNAAKDAAIEKATDPQNIMKAASAAASISETVSPQDVKIEVAKDE